MIKTSLFELELSEKISYT